MICLRGVYVLFNHLVISSERGKPRSLGKDEQTQDLVYAADILKVQATPCNGHSR